MSEDNHEQRQRRHTETDQESEAVRGELRNDLPNSERPCTGTIEERDDEHDEAYWHRMRQEGFWIDGQGWTQKAVNEWNK